LKVFLPVSVKLKIDAIKPLKNNRVVLSTSYGDLSAFLLLIQFWQRNQDWFGLPSCLRILCQCFVVRQLRACNQIFRGARCWQIQKP